MQNEEIFAFVLMPFNSDFDDIYTMGIKETAGSLGIKAERIDEQFFKGGMLDRIYRQIEIADIIIADMSGQNANVFYEVGYAHGKDKLCILLTQNAEDIPFDLKDYRHVVYGSSISSLRTSLIDELVWAKTQIENVRNSKVKVKLSNTYGLLEKTKYSARGEITFAVDLFNDSSDASAELEAIYFYSTKGWHLTQDKKECPSMLTN